MTNQEYLDSIAAELMEDTEWELPPESVFSLRIIWSGVCWDYNRRRQ